MATGKKGAKGNKTAHVLNLLTAPGEAPPPPAEEAAEGVPEAAPAASGRPLLPPILEVAQANDDTLAQQIQQALEEELSPPPAENSPVKEETPVVEDKPASGGKMSQDDIEKMLASMGAPADEPPAPEPEPAPAPQPAAEEKPAAPVPPAAEAAPTPPPEDEDLAYINVMQILVEEKAPRYIKMFGLCPCKHCQADVMALTLSNLVPKYVVLPKRDRIPMLTVYEGRFNSTIFAQLTRACKVVMDHPHHNR